MSEVNDPTSLKEQMNKFVIQLLESGITLNEAEQEFRKLDLIQALVNKGYQCKRFSLLTTKLYLILALNSLFGCAPPPSEYRPKLPEMLMMDGGVERIWVRNRRLSLYFSLLTGIFWQRRVRR